MYFNGSRMYIIEKLAELYLKLTKNEIKPYEEPQDEVEELEDIMTCSHKFMPIDSTGNILACSKCGYTVTKKRLKKEQNFFVQINKSDNQ